MAVRTRFAPSPTGELHLGHALAAKVACDLAASLCGSFLLRHEDIDTTRVRPRFYARIEEDLRWLGLAWSGEVVRQSDRRAAYDSALNALRELGVIYPCFCTRREIQIELAAMASAPHGPEGSLYPGTCRAIPPSQSQQRVIKGDPHAWRLNSALAAHFHPILTYTDLRHGTMQVNASLLGDVILARKDIGPAYHLAVVVDDAYQGITHITRGEDLLASTHVHRLLQEMLRLPEPVYLHHPLVTDADGRRLAKRDSSMSLSSLRSAGLTPQEILLKCDAIYQIERL
jgi:glutamyl-Q tRNA(Asp) synthetase